MDENKNNNDTNTNLKTSGVINDPCSFANFNDVKLNHTHLDLTVAFEERKLKGSVNLSFKVISKTGITQVILDCRDLTIQKVYDTQSKQELKFKFGKGNASVPTLGTGLEINFESTMTKDFEITIEYETSPTAEAIQWLEPQQTAGGQCMYLFTQCQAIGARTMLPCQDTPAAKNTYSANISVTSKQPYTALMSGLIDGKVENKETNMTTFKFKQPVAVASYLIALVVGRLERRDLSDRCAVYSEPETVAAAQNEFANTEKMLKAAESICGEFVWGRYDLLMLPPSFPYGGMENPNLTFLTPTLIAGDRSLDNVVAHEITHSWTGNLVTNATWEHFWLNEGWTRFIENKIVGLIHGRDYQMLDIANSHITLRQTVDKLGDKNEFTKLNLSLKDTDPDDAFSSIPYEKGSEFLRFLEKTVGGEQVFGVFAKKYLQTFANKCLDSWQFKDFFLDYFTNTVKIDDKTLATIDWDLWLKQPGLPPIMPVESKLIAQARELTAKWSARDDTYLKSSIDDIKGWYPQQTEMFLDDLLLAYQDQLSGQDTEPIDAGYLRKKLKFMLKVYKFNESRNVEICFRFNLLALDCGLESQHPKVVEMLSTVGRMKFVRPLYKGLIKNGQSVLAKDTFGKNKNFYHPICAKMVANDLKNV